MVWNSAEGGYPIDRPELNILDQSVHHSWKNLKGGFYDRWQNRRKDRRTPGGFINDAVKSWFDMDVKHIRNAINKQRELHLQVLENKGGSIKAQYISIILCSTLIHNSSKICL